MTMSLYSSAARPSTRISRPAQTLACGGSFQHFRNRPRCRYCDDMTPCRSGNNGSSTLISADDAAEARWHDSDERFQSTIVLAAIGIAHVDIQGRYIRVNRWLCDLLGYTRDELLQLTVKQISHPDDRDITDEVRAQLH